MAGTKNQRFKQATDKTACMLCWEMRMRFSQKGLDGCQKLENSTLSST